jgi:putative transcriptional regulator
MPIIVNLDVMMAKRKISLGELAERIDLTPANLSILKTGKAKAIRFSTLEAICKELLPAGRYIGIQSGRMSLICSKNAAIRNEKSQIAAFKLPFK